MRVIIRDDDAIMEECKKMVEEEEKLAGEAARDYLDESNPSVLRYLIAARRSVIDALRDDLLSLLVAGYQRRRAF